MVQDRTLVGRPDAETPQDIQLTGLGIQSEHCQLLIVDGQLFMEPVGTASCFLNNSPVISRVLMRHGDSVLWGNNHWFKVNCPRRTPTNGDQPGDEPLEHDFDSTREELFAREIFNDPIHGNQVRLSSRSLQQVATR